jgi:ComF family protein
LVEYQVSNRLPADVIVPVPLHPDREAERGYNQAGLLARALAEQVGLPIREDGLMRVRATSPQVTLNAKERQSNVAGAFRVGKGHIAGKRVLLIDDVCTTGATIEACAQALKAEGAQSAWGLTVARGR